MVEVCESREQALLCKHARCPQQTANQLEKNKCHEERRRAYNMPFYAPGIVRKSDQAASSSSPTKQLSNAL